MKAKLQGSSIIEVIVAFAIISLIFTLFSIIQNNLQNRSSIFSKIKAHNLVNEEINKLKSNIIAQESIEIRSDNCILKKTIVQHPLLPDCSVLRWTVFDNKMKVIYSAETIQKKKHVYAQ